PEAHVENEAPKSWKKFYHQRLRFASKGFKYTLPMTLGLLTYYLYNLIFLSMGLLLFTQPHFWKVALLFFVFKVSFETRFLKNAARLFGDNHPWKLMVPASFLHLFYVIYFGAAAQFMSWKWISNK
ncbi:MAG: hypothetical protein KAI81_06165, partial [Candidatus Marinimicrobia bacterium]|nr:hypothetical protein [Candidatus Neomarinimicrobiota bacterium]